ncbi:MAG: hypothetical protein HYV26_08905 [Candidatus Hydrogenedentes bacterium]|nr:hypothetical protein [Candidatus Hydrogenedentota bacterium]
MSKRILLIQPVGEALELMRACQLARVEAVPFSWLHGRGQAGAAPIDEEALIAAAKRNAVQGLWTDSPSVWPAVLDVAAHLNLPRLDAMGCADAFFEVARALEENGALVASCHLVTGQESLRAGLERLGLPVWVRGASQMTRSVFRLVEYEADLDMAVEMVKKRLPGTLVALQRPVQGTTCRVVGFKHKRDFIAVDILGEEPAPGTFRVPMTWSLPSGLGGHDYMAALNLAKKTAALLPPGHGLVEIEIVLSLEGPVLTDVVLPACAHPVMNRLVELGLGVNLLAEALRVGVGQPPQLSPSREMGAAACWIPARSGVVETVRHTREALFLQGVQAVVITAEAGDTLGHITDDVARDRIGHVIACGPTRAEALHAARTARDRIEIVTHPMM